MAGARDGSSLRHKLEARLPLIHVSPHKRLRVLAPAVVTDYMRSYANASACPPPFSRGVRAKAGALSANCSGSPPPMPPRHTPKAAFDIFPHLPYNPPSDMEYAVVETGGKQYTVHPGDILQVEKLAVAPEEALELDKVLLVAKDGNVKIGQPLVEGAKVRAEVVGNGKAPKVIVFKFKPKVRYKRKVGHRQQYTELKVTEIVHGD